MLKKVTRWIFVLILILVFNCKHFFDIVFIPTFWNVAYLQYFCTKRMNHIILRFKDDDKMADMKWNGGFLYVEVPVSATITL